MNCPNCNFLLADGVSQCPQCGAALPGSETPPTAGPPLQDRPSPLLALLGFVLPPGGALFWWKLRRTSPRRARSAGMGAVLGFWVACATIILSTTFTLFGGHLQFNFHRRAPIAAGPNAELIAQNNAMSPVDFARSSFISLSHGDPAADVGIDFENLDAGGENIGAVYTMMTSEQQKAEFRKGFVANYAQMVRMTGASIESLTNWRVESEDAYQVHIAADIPGGRTSLITVSKRGGNQKLCGFNMR